MNKNISLREFAPGNPWARVAVFAALILCVLGFFYPAIGAWTGAVGGAWLIGTQRPLRGFVYVSVFEFVPGVLSHWHKIPIVGAAYVGWMLAGAAIGALPFLLHRITNRRLRGLASTLPLPLWGVVIQALGRRLLPPAVFGLFSLPETQQANVPVMQVGAVVGAAGVAFLIYWLAALLNWIWDYNFRWEKIGAGTKLAGAFFAIAIGCGLGRQFIGRAMPHDLPLGSVLEWGSLFGGVGLTAWALTRPNRWRKSWADRTEIVALLQSPSTGEPLRVIGEKGGECLTDESGERFPIRNGIPDFLKPADITGPNQKYLRLYESIGGLYDGTQRLGGALMGVSISHLFLNFVSYLEIEPGDRVLETSVGTGLVFQYLPKGVSRFGLDLSPGMLAACQLNLDRWDMDAELFRGNAECLPFADNCFDAVYHIGGINFFSDRAKAIREMIRVAKPGSRIVISDESEKHVKDFYEKTPIAGSYYRNREDKVVEPTDLVPPEMLEIRLDSIFGGQSYVLTFRKPG